MLLATYDSRTGASSTARVGAPQVVVPQWGDQPYFAGRVAATIRTDGAALAATRLVDQFSPERMP